MHNRFKKLLQDASDEQLYEYAQAIGKEIDARKAAGNASRLEALKKEETKIWRGTWLEYAKRMDSISDQFGMCTNPYILKDREPDNIYADIEYINIYNESIVVNWDIGDWHNPNSEKHKIREWLIPIDLFDEFTLD